MFLLLLKEKFLKENQSKLKTSIMITIKKLSKVFRTEELETRALSANFINN